MLVAVVTSMLVLLSCPGSCSRATRGRPALMRGASISVQGDNTSTWISSACVGVIVACTALYTAVAIWNSSQLSRGVPLRLSLHDGFESETIVTFGANATTRVMQPPDEDVR